MEQNAAELRGSEALATLPRQAALMHEVVARGRRLLLATGLGTLMLTGAHNDEAHAITGGALPIVEHTHRTDYKGQGAWVTDQPSGLYIGRALKGLKFDKQMSSYSNNYALGVVTSSKASKVHFTGWVETDVLTFNPAMNGVRLSPYVDKLKDPYYFGKNFNCNPKGVGKCYDGTWFTGLTRKNCTAYYNFAPARQDFNNLNYHQTGKSGFRDKAGPVTTEGVSYRFEMKYPGKDKDGKPVRAVAVRTKEYGWAFMNKNCINTKQIKRGPKKTKDTVAGPNPEGGRRAHTRAA